MEPRNGTIWQRRDRNEHVARVRYEGEGNFSYSIQDVRSGGPARGSSHIRSSLAEMQELADGRVPEHECACPDWVQVQEPLE